MSAPNLDAFNLVFPRKYFCPLLLCLTFDGPWDMVGQCLILWPDEIVISLCAMIHQTTQMQSDDSSIVRFTCGGMLELSWHLYTWAGGIQVLSPKILQELCTGQMKMPQD